jgi:hypothetical protein
MAETRAKIKDGLYVRLSPVLRLPAGYDSAFPVAVDFVPPLMRMNT